jgi:uncharacterized OB-fold protein
VNDATVTGVIAPDVDVDSAWWWEALAGGRLLLPRCDDCAACFFPPLESCPRCGGRDLSRVESSGRGTVYSWVVVHVALDPAFAGDVPYTVVAVDLEEGPRLFGRWHGGEPRAGVPVRAVVGNVAGTPVLGFTTGLPVGRGER